MDEVRRHNLLYPPFYVLLFRLNKVKIVFFVCFLNYPCNKKYLKIKIQQMPWKFSMIFSGIFENIWHWEHSRGSKHLAMRAPGRAPCLLGPWWPPPLIPAPTHFIFLQKNHHPAQAQVLAHFAAIFDLLAQSSIHKTALGDCCLVCDSSIGPISFCSTALFIAIFAA